MRKLLLVGKLILVAMVLSTMMTSNSFAAYPSRTVKLIVPSKAGGSTDTTARLFAQTAKKYWKGIDFIIVDKPGSGGLMGFEAEARSRADGYTLGLMFTPQIVAHIVAKRAHYTLDSFKIVGNIAEDPEIVVVPAQSKVKNLDDLVKLAKSKKITAAVNGIGSDDFLAAKNFEALTGVKFNLMPTKGSTEEKAAILGNHIEVAFMNLSQMLAQHKAGKARIIAIMSDKRSDVAKDIKTAEEQGYKIYMTATRGMIVSAKVKKPIFDKIEALFKKVVNDKDFQAKCKKAYIFLKPMYSKDYRAYLEQLQKDTQKVYNSSPW